MTRTYARSYLLEEPASAMAAIRSIRKREGHTTRSFAALMAGHQAHVNRLELGLQMPALETLFAMAQALGYDLALVPREQPGRITANTRRPA